MAASEGGDLQTSTRPEHVSLTPGGASELELEAEHAALRNNRDYLALLRHVVALEALRARAVRDAEQLAIERARALADPASFLCDLRTGRLELPARHVLPEEPRVDWARYGLAAPADEEQNPTGEDADSETMVRGRRFTESKPDTFNQLWSCEEQRRLEELLLIYPEEEVEMNRYKKISMALGTRTPLQICSRMQKYLAKLAKVGLPIPGRAPKNVKHRRKLDTKSFQTKSTFFPEFFVPVKMEDPELTSVKCEIPEQPYRSVVELLRMAKEQRQIDRHDPVVQRRTTCIGCNKTGFVGARWTDNAGTDYCTDCIVRFQPAEKLVPVREPV